MPNGMCLILPALWFQGPAWGLWAQFISSSMSQRMSSPVLASPQYKDACSTRDRSVVPFTVVYSRMLLTTKFYKIKLLQRDDSEREEE